MKRQFWGGKLEIRQSDFNSRVGVFFDELQLCFEKILGKSFGYLSSIFDLYDDSLISLDEFGYFLNWLRKEGIKRIETIADFSTSMPDSSLEHALGTSIFILRDTQRQEDREIACENLADAIAYLSKAMQEYTYKKGESVDRLLNLSRSLFRRRSALAKNDFIGLESSIKFYEEIFPIANSHLSGMLVRTNNDFKITSDIIFDDTNFPIAA